MRGKGEDQREFENDSLLESSLSVVVAAAAVIADERERSWIYLRGKVAVAASVCACVHDSAISCSSGMRIVVRESQTSE